MDYDAVEAWKKKKNNIWVAYTEGNNQFYVTRIGLRLNLEDQNEQVQHNKAILETNSKIHFEQPPYKLLQLQNIICQVFSCYWNA